MGRKDNKNIKEQKGKRIISKTKIYAVIVLIVGIFLAMKSKKLLIFSVLVATILFFKDTLTKKENERKLKDEIRGSYPFFAQKFSMLSGAGMYPRQIFIKMAESYQRNKKEKIELYEQVIITVREIANGVPEIKAYDNFAKRCGVREIKIFSSVLNQNLRKGSVSLTNKIKKLSEEALKEQKSEIRRKGELAGSKLLFPMMILLVVVFVMIMMPAFSMFTALG